LKGFAPNPSHLLCARHPQNGRPNTGKRMSWRAGVDLCAQVALPNGIFTFLLGQQHVYLFLKKTGLGYVGMGRLD
jgi:hypothetical protein